MEIKDDSTFWKFAAGVMYIPSLVKTCSGPNYGEKKSKFWGKNWILTSKSYTFLFIQPRIKITITSLTGLYNLYSEEHPLSLDSQVKWGKTWYYEKQPLTGETKMEETSGRLAEDGQMCKRCQKLITYNICGDYSSHAASTPPWWPGRGQKTWKN